MKISNAGSVSNKDSKVKKKSSASDGSFSRLMNVEETSATSGVAPVNPVSAIAVLNEVEGVDSDGRKRQAVNHGNEILDELENLRDGLLYGGVSVGRLERINQMLSQKREQIQDDPKLEELINEIEVRAAVELAKMGLV